MNECLWIITWEKPSENEVFDKWAQFLNAAFCFKSIPALLHVISQQYPYVGLGMGNIDKRLIV